MILSEKQMRSYEILSRTKKISRFSDLRGIAAMERHRGAGQGTVLSKLFIYRFSKILIIVAASSFRSIKILLLLLYAIVARYIGYIVCYITPFAEESSRRRHSDNRPIL